MNKMNITLQEAAERSRVINTVDSYHIALDLTASGAVFRVVSTVKFSAEKGAVTWIDAITDTVHSVVLNGKEKDPTAVSDGFRIQLSDLASNNELTIIADMSYTNTGEGLHRFVDPVDHEVYLYSQFEVPDSRRMYPVFEQPDLKSQFNFTVTAPSHWSITSNSAILNLSKVNETSSRWEFAPTEIISSYITALIAGPYKSFHSETTSADGRSIALGIFARKSLADFVDPDNIFELTRQGFSFYEDQFKIPYPFSKYDQLFVPEFNAGAMENAGAVTITESYIFRSKVSKAVVDRRAITILHELAHMWFGDLVTMKWWNDLWLNESFAEYMSHLAAAQGTQEFTQSWTTFAATEKSWAYRQDQLPSTHPIVADIKDLNDVLVNFDGITYAKGASVLKQLVAWTGQEKFMTALHYYFIKYSFANTELKDLMLELEGTSGRDLQTWTSLWLETPGVNTLKAQITTDSDDVITNFIIEQSAPAAYPAIRPHRLAVGFYTRDKTGRFARKDGIELDIEGKKTKVEAAIGKTHPAGASIVLLNDDDLTFAKIRLDERSWKNALADLKNIDNSLARALIWGIAWDATRDAQLPPHHYVHLVLNNIGAETDSSVIAIALRQLGTALTLYVNPATREKLIAQSGDTLWKLTNEAEVGSDRQFQFLKAFATHAQTSQQLDNLQAVFNGSLVLGGIKVDTDLRWELLTALVVNGRLGSEAIDQELLRDETASGHLAAATAQAAIPTMQAKTMAWEKIIDDGTLPNALQRATIVGFNRVADQGLLAAFADRYFEVVPDVWADRSHELAQQIVTGLYPTIPPTEKTLSATRAFVARQGGRQPALIRLIIENEDGIKRALAAQKADIAEKPEESIG